MGDDGQVSGDILDSIDGALSDWSVSKDAMRWNPDAPAIEAQSRNSADFSLAMLPPLLPYGHLDIWGHSATPAIAQIEEGMIIQVDGSVSLGGQLWRVTSRTQDEDGTYRFDLEPA
jgi:hypothetical protein